jgi:hypothetical protein
MNMLFFFIFLNINEEKNLVFLLFFIGFFLIKLKKTENGVQQQRKILQIIKIVKKIIGH